MNLNIRSLKYLQLFRFQTAATTASAPLIGSLIMGQNDIFLLIIIFIIGILYHIYGFVLNEYIDVEVDRKSIDLKNKPLVDGSIPARYALFIALFACFLSIILALIFFQNILTLLFLFFAAFLGGFYNVFGKKIPGLDFILGLGFFFICLMGASTATYDFTILTYIVCSVYFIHITYFNSVEGGIKDADHDYLAGAKTIATAMGVYIKNGNLIITKKFLAFAYILKFIFLCLIVLLCIQPEINLFNYEKNIIQLILVIFLFVVIFFTMYKFLKVTLFNRPELKKLFSFHEMSSYFIFIISLSPLIKLWPTLILIFLPFLWYIFFNFILYGKFLQPQV